MSDNIMSTSTRKKVNKEWGIEEERYARTAPGFTKRKLRKSDTLPIIFAIAVMVFVSVLGWNMKAKASGDPIPLAISFSGTLFSDVTDPQNVVFYDAVSYGESVEHIATPYVYGEEIARPSDYTEIITYSSSDSSVASIDAQSGAITVLSPGTTTITATAPDGMDPNEPSSLKYVGISSSYILTVEKIDVTITASYDAHVYDGTTNVDNFVPTLNGVLDADRNAVFIKAGTGVVAYEDEFPGENKPITVITPFELDGAKASCYELTQPDDLTGTIQKRPLTITSGIVAADKTYDGNTTASLSLSDSARNNLDIVLGDDVTVVGTGTFAQSNAGTNISVTFGLSNLHTDGNDKDYYEVSSVTQTSATARILPKSVSVSGIIARDKIYNPATPNDVTANLITTGVLFSGKILGDVLTVNATGAFKTPGVGNNKTVDISYDTLNPLGGASASNYILAVADSQPTTTASIVLEPTITVASGSVYTGRDVEPSVTVKIGNTTLVKDSDYTVRYTRNIEAGQHAIVTISPVTGSAYSFTATSKEFVINPKPVTVSGIIAREKEYDGTTVAYLNCANATISVPASGDDVYVRKAKGVFVNRNAGENIEVTISNIMLAGHDANNYVLNETGSQQKAYANITRATVEPSVVISPKSLASSFAFSVTVGKANSPE